MQLSSRYCAREMLVVVVVVKPAKVVGVGLFTFDVANRKAVQCN